MIIDCRATKFAESEISHTSIGAVTFGSASGYVVLNPNAAGFYDPVQESPGGTWPDGASVPISASGGGLPPFAFTLKMPAVLDMLQPDIENTVDNELEIDTAVPLELAWSPTDETAYVEIAQYAPATQSVDAWDFQDRLCMFAGSAGTATIPVEVLKDFDTTRVATVSFGHCALNQTELGGRAVWLEAAHSVNRQIKVK